MTGVLKTGTGKGGRTAWVFDLNSMLQPSAVINPPPLQTRMTVEEPTASSRAGDVEETTPLLHSQRPQHELVYERFSSRQKKFIVAMVSICGIIPLFIGGTFIPCIPQISKDLNTTGPVVSMGVSVSIFGASMGGLTASSYSTYYGRRPIYLTFLPLLIFGSFAVAVARTVPELMIWRFLQAFGTSPGFSVGAGVIGDIYKVEERGTAMGIFYSVSHVVIPPWGCETDPIALRRPQAVLLGPAIAPFIGGFAAHYSSWRILQAAIGVAALVIFVMLASLLPETSHPGERGVDKANLAKQKGKSTGDDESEQAGLGRAIKNKLPVFLNPFAPLWLLKSPNLLFVCFASLFVLLTDYVLLVPIAYTIGEKYGITNEAIIGACFLPAGLGNMIGAPLAGRLSDYIVVRYRRKRGGVWYPEDRLRAALYALPLVPTSMVITGLCTTYITDKTLGLSIFLACLFINGVGVDIVLTPPSTYIVDIMQKRSAEGTAANNSFRSVIMGCLVAGILPMIDAYGPLVTNSVSAVLSLVGFGFLWVTIRHGEQLRQWGKVGDLTDDEALTSTVHAGDAVCSYMELDGFDLRLEGRPPRRWCASETGMCEGFRIRLGMSTVTAILGLRSPLQSQENAIRHFLQISRVLCPRLISPRTSQANRLKYDRRLLSERFGMVWISTAIGSQCSIQLEPRSVPSRGDYAPQGHPYKLASSMRTLLLIHALLSLSVDLTLGANYALSEAIIGPAFYDKFIWFYAADPSHGRVNYTDKETSKRLNLTYATSDSFILRADYKTVLNPSGPGRNSVRMRTNNSYTTHVAVFVSLFSLNCMHADGRVVAGLTFGICPKDVGKFFNMYRIQVTHVSILSTWPAIWETKAAVWPAGGEVDVLEGVHGKPPNIATLHTTAGCTMPANRSQTGSSASNNCEGDATFAMERRTNFIKVWFWHRKYGHVPSFISNPSEKLNTDGWVRLFSPTVLRTRVYRYVGTPAAYFPNTTCDMTKHFTDHHIVMNLGFCGDWAGPAYASSGCPSTCADFVNKNTDYYKDAFFDIAAVRIYKQA
ncbi:hypothetical protein NMY22_g7540 [Coprinellus aureogranulatus]|nr:hypothetical protein NMY22_g7540 [Coprinellus aureogranulatus]